jgi:phenylacetate-CoA ligase
MDDSTSPPRRYFNPYAERASRDEIANIQWLKLQRLLSYAYERSPFYRRRFDAAGVRLDRLKSLRDFQKAVPILRKEDILAAQQVNPPYGDQLCVDARKIVQVNVTGGTTGKGQEIHALTSADVPMVTTGYTMGCYWAGVNRDEAVADTFPVSMSGGGLWLYGSYVRQHANLFSMGTYPTLTKLKYLKQFGIGVLTATPSYLQTMRSTAQTELGWDVAKDLSIRTILTATENFTAARAEEIERDWGAKLFEWYGSTQRALGATCEYGAVYGGRLGVIHHFPHIILMETLNRDTQEPVGYGEDGEVVVTFLESEASPMIRFGMNDKAKLLPAEQCPCGRKFDGYLAGNITRYDDMLKVRGVNFWPAMTDEILLAVPEVANYGGTVTSAADGRERILVEVEFKSEATAETRSALTERLANELRLAIGLQMEVREATQALPTGSDFQAKIRRWKDLRAK